MISRIVSGKLESGMLGRIRMRDELFYLILVIAALGGCSRDQTAPPTQSAGEIAKPRDLPNIILISVDTLRPDHLGCYGYSRATSPNIDRLAREGTLFETAVSSSSWTLPAHAAMFTGLSDSVHGATDTDKALADSHHTLAERLHEAGYKTAGFFSGPTLYPAFGLGQGFETYIDCTSYPDLSAESVVAADRKPGIEWGGDLQRASMSDITSPRVYQAVKKWLREGEAPAEPTREGEAPTESKGEHGSQSRATPFFLFIHLWDCHFDFIPPAPYDTMFDPGYTGTITGRDLIFNDAINKDMPKSDLEHLVALYDGEIAWTDAHIGKILDELTNLGLLDSSLVILLADHGTEFFEHGAKGHRQTLFDESIRIPLIVRRPGHVPAGQRIKDQARMIDVLPTTMDLAGLPAPDRVMGRSLAGVIAGKPLEKAVALSELDTYGHNLSSYRQLDRKLIRHETSKSWIAFNLRSDPAELRPLQDAKNPLVSVCLRELEQTQAWLRENVARYAVPVATPELPEAVRQRLQSLGYIGSQEDEPVSDHP